MMKSYYKIGLIFIILILGIGLVSAADISTSNNATNIKLGTDSADVIEVDDMNSQEVISSEPVKESGASFADIQSAVDKASSKDVIELEGQYYSNGKVINVNKPLTIQGSENGATLDAKSLQGVFEINSDVILKNLIIKNTKDSAIVQKSGEKHDLIIINCSFIDYHASSIGGAIDDENIGSLTIINSTFDNITAYAGAAIYSRVGDTSITNSSFTNIVSYTNAIYFRGNTLTIDNSVFENNTANTVDDDYGAGVILTLGKINRISNSIFNNNKATIEAGAIYARAITDDGNQPSPKLTILNCKFNNCSGDAASYVYTLLCDVDIENSFFNTTSCDVYIRGGSFTNKNNTLKNAKVIDRVKLTLVPPGTFTTQHDSGESFDVFVDFYKALALYTAHLKIVVKSKTLKKEFYADADREYEDALFKVSKLPVGTYTVKVYVLGKYYTADPVKSKITIKKATPIVKAKKVTAKYKKSKKFTVKVKSKYDKHPIENLKLKIKVYTGKKSKSYTVKTNKKGVASINTKKIKRGTHKVVVKSKNKNYVISKKSSIKIK